MTLPLHVAIKDFFGLWVLTPFEQALLKRLSEALEPDTREVLAYQLAHFTTVRRLTRYVDSPQAYGYTFFYTLRYGKDVSEKKQLKRFAFNEPETLLATTQVIFDSGEIDVRFRLVNGVLFSIEYRSPQKIYYPQGCYDIESLTVRHLGDAPLKEATCKAVKKALPPNSTRPVLFLFPQEREMHAYLINNPTLIFSKAYGSHRNLERKYQNAFILSHDGVREVKHFRILKHAGDSIGSKLRSFIAHVWEIDIQYSDLLPYSLEQVKQLMVSCSENNNWNCYGIAMSFDSFIREITSKSTCLDELFTFMKLPEDELDDVLSL